MVKALVQARPATPLQVLLDEYQTACTAGTVSLPTLRALVHQLQPHSVKAFLKATTRLLKHNVETFDQILPEITPVLPLFQPHSSLFQRLFRRVVSLYFQNSEKTKVCMEFIQSVMKVSGMEKTGFLTEGLKTYKSICKEQRKDLNLIQQRVLKLMKIDVVASSRIIDSEITKLITNLRENNEIGSFISWQFVQNVQLYGFLLGKMQKDTDKLHVFVFMILKMSEELRFLPFKLHLIGVLIDFERSTGRYIPGITSYLMSFLSSPDLHRRVKPTSASIDLDNMLEVKKSFVVTQTFQETSIEKVCEKILSHVAVFGRSTWLPELCMPVMEVINKEITAQKLPNSRLKSVLGKTVKALAEGSKWVEMHRGMKTWTGESPLTRLIAP